MAFEQPTTAKWNLLGSNDAFFNAAFLAWTSFTPAWGNLTEGNGQNEGYYLQLGKTIFFRARFILGSTSSITGAVSLALPVTKIATMDDNYLLGHIVRLLDAGTAFYYGTMLANGNLVVHSTGSTYLGELSVTATVPFTWVTTDTIWVSGIYEAA